MLRKLLDFLRSLFRKGESKPESRGEVVTIMDIKKGDTHDPATAQIDSELPLADVTVRFHMVADDGTLLVDSEATVDASSGEVVYHFSDGETDTVGTHGVEWVVSYNGEQETHPKVGYHEIKIDEPLERPDNEDTVF